MRCFRSCRDEAVGEAWKSLLTVTNFRSGGINCQVRKGTLSPLNYYVSALVLMNRRGQGPLPNLTISKRCLS